MFQKPQDREFGKCLLPGSGARGALGERGWEHRGGSLHGWVGQTQEPRVLLSAERSPGCLGGRGTGAHNVTLVI